MEEYRLPNQKDIRRPRRRGAAFQTRPQEDEKVDVSKYRKREMLESNSFRYADDDNSSTISSAHLSDYSHHLSSLNQRSKPKTSLLHSWDDEEDDISPSEGNNFSLGLNFAALNSSLASLPMHTLLLGLLSESCLHPSLRSNYNPELAARAPITPVEPRTKTIAAVPSDSSAPPIPVPPQPSPITRVSPQLAESFSIDSIIGKPKLSSVKPSASIKPSSISPSAAIGPQTSQQSGHVQQLPSLLSMDRELKDIDALLQLGSHSDHTNSNASPSAFVSSSETALYKKEREDKLFEDFLSGVGVIGSNDIVAPSQSQPQPQPSIPKPKTAISIGSDIDFDFLEEDLPKPVQKKEKPNQQMVKKEQDTGELDDWLDGII